ncbi:MAG: lipoyl(octanoyl) transferase LipB [Desulfuromonadaceae bacterium]|nr:lipoyl(octanoyl) transferase LipB [Desulfuromonadaceae bacterium]
MRVIDCGLIGFHEAFALQEMLAAGIAAGREDETLLLLEHHPIYTIGSGGDRANILDPTLTVESINRGGDVTWHGPGQVVGYPLVNLGKRGRDLHRWLRFLEELLVATLTSFGINGWCRHGSTGVWTGRGKIAFIGVGVRRWVTMHGFALNVHPDLRAYKQINPCGLPGCPVTSMELEGGVTATDAAVRVQLKKDFERLLNERMMQHSALG